MSMGSLAEDKPCTCDSKDRANWVIISAKKKIIDGHYKTYAFVECLKCNGHWRTCAKYVNDLKRFG